MDPADLTLAAATRLIAGDELLPTDLVRSCLARTAAQEPEIRAFVTLDESGATDRARRPKADGGGSLLGIPLGIKDIIDVAGMPTTGSSKLLTGNAATVDAPVVARLLEAGAVIVGKTNTHELAYGVISTPTTNPWNPAHIPGGSSGGSAAAVATGMCLGALGTDTAGSIRIPAALCGISGLKPRRAALPMRGIIPLAPSLDACGPMARTAEDLAIMWHALIGHSPELAGPRLRVAAPLPSAVVEIDPEIEAAVTGSIDVLTGAVTMTDVNLPRFEEWDFPRAVKLMSEALQVHTDRGWYPDRAADYTEETVASLRYAERFEPGIRAEAESRLAELVAGLMGAFDDADVLLLPTTPTAAPTAEEATVLDDSHRPPVARSLTRICGPINVCDLAAASVSCGFTRAGLPIGVQFVARDEATALRAALEYQRLTEWHERRPIPPQRT